MSWTLPASPPVVQRHPTDHSLSSGVTEGLDETSAIADFCLIQPDDEGESASSTLVRVFVRGGAKEASQPCLIHRDDVINHC